MQSRPFFPTPHHSQERDNSARAASTPFILLPQARFRSCFAPEKSQDLAEAREVPEGHNLGGSHSQVPARAVLAGP